MNDKQEQERIEEMAKIIIKAGESYYKMPVDIECANREAVALYEENYRKQSDTVREFVDRLILELIALRSEEFDGKELAINGKTYKYLVMRAKEIAAEYGVEVEK